MAGIGFANLRFSGDKVADVQVRILALAMAFLGLFLGLDACAQIQCSQLLKPMSWMDPVSLQARFAKLSGQEIYSFNKIQMPPNELHPFTAIDGGNNIGTYWAQIGGQKVFVKEVALPNALIVRDMAWMQIIFELGLGPKLIGFMRMPSGHTGIISEWVSGQFIRSLNRLAGPSDSVKLQLTQINKLFQKLHIKPIDFQFFIDEQSRVRIVDVGFYSFSNDERAIDAMMSYY